SAGRAASCRPDRRRSGGFLLLRGEACLLLPGLDAVLGARLLAIAHTGGVEGAADDLVADARKILHTAASHEDDRVLLQVVPFARDVGGDLHPVGEPHTRDLAQRRIRLLGRGRIDARADAAALRRGETLLAALAGLEAWRSHLLLGLLTSLADELIDTRHAGADPSSDRAPNLRTVDCGLWTRA